MEANAPADDLDLASAEQRGQAASAFESSEGAAGNSAFAASAGRELVASDAVDSAYPALAPLEFDVACSVTAASPAPERAVPPFVRLLPDDVALPPLVASRRRVAARMSPAAEKDQNYGQVRRWMQYCRQKSHSR